MGGLLESRAAHPSPWRVQQGEVALASARKHSPKATSSTTWRPAPQDFEIECGQGSPTGRSIRRTHARIFQRFAVFVRVFSRGFRTVSRVLKQFCFFNGFLALSDSFGMFLDKVPNGFREDSEVVGVYQLFGVLFFMVFKVCWTFRREKREPPPLKSRRKGGTLIFTNGFTSFSLSLCGGPSVFLVVWSEGRATTTTMRTREREDGATTTEKLER